MASSFAKYVGVPTTIVGLGVTPIAFQYAFQSTLFVCLPSALPVSGWYWPWLFRAAVAGFVRAAIDVSTAITSRAAASLAAMSCFGSSRANVRARCARYAARCDSRAGAE